MSARIDIELGFPLELRLNDGTDISVSNLRKDQQPPELFQIPTGFQRFDPETLIERIKQSDVWVEESPR